VVKTNVVKISVLVASLVLVTACSGSNDAFEQGSTAVPDGINETEPSSDATTLSDERAEFAVSECGSLPVSTALSGNVVSAPGTMAIGQLVSGRINPNTAANAEHYWSLELEPGEYHLVLDTEGADGGWSNLSIGVTEIRDTGEVALLEGDKTDYRARFHSYFSVEVARTMVVRIQGNNSAEDYVLAIFKNGTRVPAPFFSECPVINLLNLDTTETFVLPREENSTDYHWFRVRLITADYAINTSASVTSASQIEDASCQVQYEFNLVEQFGQSERITSIGSVDTPGPVATNSVVEFERKGFDPAWIRVQNNNCELSVEFTISKSDG